MKYLSDYTEAKQTALFNDCGAFFAFSQSQFDEKKKDGINYSNVGSGLICESEFCDKLIEGLENINTEAIKQDIAENGKKAIIHRELANHECQITMSIADCVNKLEFYPITKEEIQAEWKEFFQKCIDNDWF